jgi:hypothetical protein
MDGTGIVGGVNDYLKTHTKPAHGHVHHHQKHSSKDIDDESPPVPEPLTKADKAALKKDNARAKAEIEINQAKIEEEAAKIESNKRIIEQENDEIKTKQVKKDEAEENSNENSNKAEEENCEGSRKGPQDFRHIGQDAGEAEQAC